MLFCIGSALFAIEHKIFDFGLKCFHSSVSVWYCIIDLGLVSFTIEQ